MPIPTGLMEPERWAGCWVAVRGNSVICAAETAAELIRYLDDHATVVDALYSIPPASQFVSPDITIDDFVTGPGKFGTGLDTWEF